MSSQKQVDRYQMNHSSSSTCSQPQPYQFSMGKVYTAITQHQWASYHQHKPTQLVFGHQQMTKVISHKVAAATIHKPAQAPRIDRIAHNSQVVIVKVNSQEIANTSKRKPQSGSLDK